MTEMSLDDALKWAETYASNPGKERRREVRALLDRITQLDGWVTWRDERIACLEDELAEAQANL